MKFRMVRTLLALVFAAPFVYLALLSVAGNWRYPALLPERFGLEHWSEALQNGQLLHSAALSVLLSVGVASISTATAFMGARVVAAHPRRNLLLRLAYLPYAFSPVIYAFSMQVFFLKAQLAGTLAGVMLAQFFIVFPFLLILFTPHWTGRLPEMEQLVYTLGGSEKEAWKRVLLPLSGKILRTGFFQAALISWFDYGMTQVIGSGQVMTLSLRIFQYIGESNPYFAALGSCLFIFPPLLLLWINKRFVYKAL